MHACYDGANKTLVDFSSEFKSAFVYICFDLNYDEPMHKIHESVVALLMSDSN